MKNKLILLFLCAFIFAHLQPVSSQIIYNENFGNSEFWSGGTMSGYNEKFYVNPNDPFSGIFHTNAAVRESTYTLSDYAWRLDDLSGTFLRYSCYSAIDSFSFYMTRWDNSPLPEFVIRISNDNGNSFENLFQGDGNLFILDKEYMKFNFKGLKNIADSALVIEILNISGERLLIDDFSIFYDPNHVDTIPPVLRWNPIDKSEDIDIDMAISLNFMEEVFKSDGTTKIDSVYLSDQIQLIDKTSSRESVPFSFVYQDSTNEVVIKPINSLLKSHSYAILIDSIFDQSCNYLMDSITFFTEMVKPEPPIHVSDFIYDNLRYNSFDLKWYFQDSLSLPDGFLLAINQENSFLPLDGTIYNLDSLSNINQTIYDLGEKIDSIHFEKLLPNTVFEIKIYPYSNDGNEIDYKTDGVIPTLQFQTPDYPRIIISELAGLGYDESYKNEYIEIYNADTISYDLSNFIVEYYEELLEKSIQLYDSIFPHESKIISSRSEINLNGIQSIFDQFLSINNDFFIKLKDKNDLLIDEIGDSLHPFMDDFNYIFFNYENENKEFQNWYNLGSGNGTPGIKNLRWFNNITNFSFNEISGALLKYIEPEQAIVKLEVPYKTDRSNLTPTISCSDSAQVYPKSGLEQNFSDTVIYTVFAENGDSKIWHIVVDEMLNNEHDIVQLLFTEFDQPIYANIDFERCEAKAILPFGADLNHLNPQFKISEGAYFNTDTSLLRDFSNPVDLLITAANGESQLWKIIIETELNQENEILSFYFEHFNPYVYGHINNSLNYIEITVPFGSAIYSLSPVIEISENANIFPESRTELDFSEIVQFEVISEAGTSNFWDVLVKIAPDTAKEFLDFGVLLDGEIVSGKMDSITYQVFIELPFGTNLENLVAVFNSTGKVVMVDDLIQESGVSINNFSNPVYYSVLAEDLSSQMYTIQIFPKDPSDEARLEWLEIEGVELFSFHPDTFIYLVELPFGTLFTPEISWETIDSTAKIVLDITSFFVQINVIAQDGISINEYKIEFQIAKNDDVTISSQKYLIDERNKFITNIGYKDNLVTFKENFNLAYGASIQVFEQDTIQIANKLHDNCLLKVTAENQNQYSFYNLNVNEEPDIYISEYLEGSSFNKAIELYNPFLEDRDLNEYYVAIGVNGQNFHDTLFLTGILKSESTFVICNVGAEEELMKFSDLKDTLNTVLTFNGNDCIGLFHNSQLIDVVGKQGEYIELAWPIDTIKYATKDKNIRRKMNVITGNNNWFVSSKLLNEWDIFELDDYSNIGLRKPNTENKILYFSLLDLKVDSEIDTMFHEIRISLYEQVELSEVIIDFEVSRNAKVFYEGQELLSKITPVHLINNSNLLIVSESGDQKIWRFAIDYKPILSNEKEIISFQLQGIESKIYIDNSNFKVFVEISDSIGIYHCIPNIQISKGASLEPEASLVQDFSTVFQYTVTAENGTSEKWQIIPNFNLIPQIRIEQIQFAEQFPFQSPYEKMRVKVAGNISYKDHSEMYMQDKASAWSGILVNYLNDSLFKGDSILIEATVIEYNGITELSEIKLVASHATENFVIPINLNADEGINEKYESVLIQMDAIHYIGYDVSKKLHLFEDKNNQFVPIKSNEALDIGRYYDIIGIPVVGFEEHIKAISITENLNLSNAIIANEEPINSYPNPAYDYIYFTINSLNRFNFNLFNCEGLLVKSGQFNETLSKIFLGDLSPGLYFIIVENDWYFRTFKFLKI